MRPMPLATLLLCALAGAGCSTTYAEINGPRAGIAIEIDHDLHVSPRIEVGWDYDKWNNAFGYGGSVGTAWTPLAGRVDMWIEGRILAFPLLGPAPISPIALGPTASWTHAEGWTFGVRGGIGTLMYWPPSACVPPLEGNFEGCPAGSRSLDDVVQRPWLPRIDYRFSAHWNVSGVKDKNGDAKVTMVHSLGFGATWAIDEVVDALR